MPDEKKPEVKLLTIEEYMDPERFPLTTQKGLQPDMQLFLDANRADMARDMAAAKHKWDDGEKAILRELREKMPSHSKLTKEVAQKKIAEQKAKKTEQPEGPVATQTQT